MYKKNHVLSLKHFQDEIVHLFFLLQKEALKSERAIMTEMPIKLTEIIKKIQDVPVREKKNEEAQLK